MIMIILGAGASHDCVDLDMTIEGDTPPLAKDLFTIKTSNSAMLKYKETRPLVMELREQLNKSGDSEKALSIEELLGEVSANSKDNTALKKQIIALRYYLKHVIDITSLNVTKYNGGATIYNLFLGKLQKWQNTSKEPILFVNFNYDLLLEQALESSGIDWNVSKFSDYTERNDFKLVKPHGSVDWSRRVEIPDANSPDDYEKVINMYPIVNIESSKIYHNYETLPAQYTQIPALAAPISGKESFECPSIQIDHLKSFMSDITKILVIGWRGAEPHFKEVINKIKEANIYIVGKSKQGVGETNVNLSFINSPKFRSEYYDGFTKFVHSSKLQQFLEA